MSTEQVAVSEAALPGIVTLTLDDALHYTALDREERIAAMLPHERDARAKGIPLLGSGVIFPVSDDDIQCDAFPIPAHWRQIGGLDFGIDHPFAASRVAHDLENDAIYVTATYTARRATPLQHCPALKAWGGWLPFAWPHDGLQHDKGSGDQLAGIYRGHGLNLLPEHSSFPDGTYGVEAGLAMMLQMMETGRFKIFRQCAEPWLLEKAGYHRKEGKIVKEADDVISSTRYALMSLRFAANPPGMASSQWKPPGW